MSTSTLKRLRSEASGLPQDERAELAYDVVVRDSDNDIVVSALAHHSRRPRYWKNRPDK
jgi:hypothetical protein